MYGGGENIEENGINYNGIEFLRLIIPALFSLVEFILSLNCHVELGTNHKNSLYNSKNNQF